MSIRSSHNLKITAASLLVHSRLTLTEDEFLSLTLNDQRGTESLQISGPMNTVAIATTIRDWLDGLGYTAVALGSVCTAMRLAEAGAQVVLEIDGKADAISKAVTTVEKVVVATTEDHSDRKRLLSFVLGAIAGRVFAKGGA